ncbi:outer membrane beta-barrel protein [Aliivibrio logei]|uniref:LysM domain-containing protein n=1 Tax=Aliivibrio logei 5S-186 TaxID=626086 RepID=A0ABX3B004_ALILO|nr:outer membrane beta-barrel protein [Aliivibrio logei]OEF22523.1 hypothetical protein A1Q5_15720 [Aliivibrio logei 5S-186]
MKKLPILALITSLSTSVYAEEQYVPFQFGAGAVFSVLDDDLKESESMGYELILGYHLNDMFLLESGFTNYNPNEEKENNIDLLLTRLKVVVPISDYSSLYAGGGIGIDNQEIYPTLNVGLQYKINTNWYADIGYQGMFGVEPQQVDLYSFNISFIYRFSYNNKDDKSVDLKEDIVEYANVMDKKPVIEDKLPVIKPNKIVIKEKPKCTTQYKRYKVKSGDTMLKISRLFNLALKDVQLVDNEFNLRDINLIYPDEIVNIKYNTCR